MPKHVTYAIREDQIMYRLRKWRQLSAQARLLYAWENPAPPNEKYPVIDVETFECARCQKLFTPFALAWIPGKCSFSLCSACIRIPGWGDIYDPEAYRQIHTGAAWWGWAEMHPMAGTATSSVGLVGGVGALRVNPGEI